MRRCSFSGQPTVFTSVKGNGYNSRLVSTGDIVTQNNVMNPKEFTAHLRTMQSISLSTIRSHKWELQWCAFGESKMTPDNNQVCCGSSNAQDWLRHDNDQIYTDVKSTGCEFKGDPMFFTSISDKACGSELLGSARCVGRTIASQSIYSQSKNGFRTYVRAVPGDTALNYATARANGWQITWCGVAKMPASVEGKGGYPCTSPRLLKGNNDNGVFTNNGEICCDHTSGSDWKKANTQAISKVVDISACGFKKINYIITNMRGDSPLQMTSGGTSWAPTNDASKIEVYVQTAGKYKFYNAEQYHWKVQYCVFGK